MQLAASIIKQCNMAKFLSPSKACWSRDAPPV